MRPPVRLLLACAATTVVLTACASTDAPGGAPPHPPRLQARAPGCGPLFVSPAGEPFRRAPDAPGCPLRAWFSRADADGDGALSRAEFRADALRFFDVLDTDGNGYLDGRELQIYEHRIAPEILGRGGGPRAALGSPPRLLPAALQMGGGRGGDGGMGGGRGGGGRGGRGGRHGAQDGGGPRAGSESGAGLARFGLLEEPEPVAGADLDFDGRITRAEFATRADQRFRSLDEADAGRLTYADLERRLRARASGGEGRSPGRS